jgi:general secretion pathway protein F
MCSAALQLLGVGEASGDLPHLAEEAGALVTEEARRHLRSLVSLLEPALVIGLGLAVALVAAALLQAVYSVRPGV